MGLERLAPPTAPPTAPPPAGPPAPRSTAPPITPPPGVVRPGPAPKPEPRARPAARAGTAAAGSRRSGRQRYPTREERAQRALDKEVARSAEMATDPVGYARQVCLQLLELRPRTRHELQLALTARGVPEDAAQQVLERFAEVGMIDDALFAQLWVSSRHRGRGLAGRSLAQELRRKGVDEELVRDAVDQLDPGQEDETARALVRRKLDSTRGLAAEARIRRLAGMLARKGYGAGVAFRIVKQELEREGGPATELSFEALQSLEQ